MMRNNSNIQPRGTIIYGILILLLSVFQSVSAQTEEKPNKVISFEIKAPDKILITLIEQLNPLAFGSTDGTITVDIDDGTANPDGSYTVVWRNSSNTQLSTTTAQVIGGKYRTSLNSIGKGTYTITVLDNAYAATSAPNNSGCTTSASYTLTEPAVLLVTVSKVKSISCNGGTGTLKANPSGGPTGTSYKYKWYKVSGSTETLLSATSREISNLAAGTYKVVIKDKNDISKTSSNYILTTPGVLSFSNTLTNVFCNGGNNGAIDITVVGGTSPYRYKWIDGSTSEDRINLTKGKYFLKVTDNNGCEIDNYATGILISQPTNSLALSTDTILNVSVNDGNDGAIAITVYGGTPSYTYEWIKEGTSGVFSTNQDISNLSEGKYTVTIKDNKYNSTSSNSGCQIVQQYTITAPEELLVYLIEQEITCFNASNGALTAVGTGGVQIPTLGYSYQWFKKNGGSYFSIGQITKTATGLDIGTYKITITDNNGNKASNTITISQPTQLEIEFTKQHVLCKGGSNGSIDITMSGGTIAYMYSWLNSDGIQIATTEDISNVKSDTYHLIVKDSNNCILERSIEIKEPIANLDIQLRSLVHPSEFQATDGAINIEVSGGTGSYSYQWTDATNSNVGTLEDIENLGTGKYTLTVKDANYAGSSDNLGCLLSKIFTLIEPDLLTVEINVTKGISCFNNQDGILRANGTGGVLPYNYEWFEINESGIKTSLGETTQEITGIQKGVYSVKITDGNMVTTNATNFNFEEPAELLISNVNTTNVLCFNKITGEIEITITGGTEPYTYAWNTGDTTEDISGIAAGNYNVVVTDANNCSVTKTDILISQPTEALYIANDSITNLTGFETNNGSITANAAGGNPLYSYSWTITGDNNVIATTNTASNLAAGNYELTLTDTNGCILLENYEVTQPDKLLVVIEQPLFNLCNNDAVATIQANVTGGVSPYAYHWYDLINPTVNLGTNVKLENRMAGSYGVLITDNNAIETYGEITIVQPDQLVVEDTITDVLCFGAQTGAITLNVLGGTGNYRYFWSTGATTTTVSTLYAGTYSVTVTDENNCSITEQYTINEPDAPLQLSNTVITEPLGFGDSNGSINITVSGGTPNYTYVWYNKTGDLQSETSSVLSNIVTGNYRVVITDSNNCNYETTFVVNEPPLLEVTINQTEKIDCKGLTGSIIAIVKGGVLTAGTSYSYAWFNSDDAQIDNVSELSGIVAGDYYVIVTDSNVIQKKASFSVKEPDTLAISNRTKVDVICYSGQNGTIDISVIGGTGTYSYQWSNGASTEDLTELISGNYTVTITDENNCSVTETITINQPVLYDVESVSLVRPSGSNSDGSIAIEMTGGELPFTFQWFDSSGILVQETLTSMLSTNSLINVQAETYTIIITDSIGCVHTETYNLANPGELIADIEQIQEVSCFSASDGQLMVNSIGGVGGNTYVWYNSLTNTVLGNDSDFLLDIPVGAYYVVVRNAEGVQEQSEVFIVNQPDIVQATAMSQNLSCFQSNDGSIDLQAVGGSNIFDYRLRQDGNLFTEWSSFLDTTTSTINDLSSGNYQLQVRDSNGCNFEQSGIIQNLYVNITQPDVLEVSSNIISDATGFGLANGSIALQVTGGTLPYTITWVDANDVSQSATTQTLANSIAGKYIVHITDAQGCTLSGTYTINQPDLLKVTINLKNIILCNGDKNGSLMATVTGGYIFESGTPYTYNWYLQGDATVIGTEIGLDNLGKGIYYVLVEDKKGNSTQSDVFVLTEPDTLEATLNSEYINCGTANDWNVSTTVQGGTQPYTYSWSTGDNTSEITNVVSGTYLVIITDAQGCEIIETHSIDVPEILSVQATVTQVNCFDACEGMIALDITGGVLPYTIKWNTSESSLGIENLCPGTYSVLVTDQKGCEITKEYTIDNPALIVVDLGDDITLCNGQSHYLDSVINDENASYKWTSGNGFSSNKSSVSLSEAGIYTVTITTGLGCIVSDSIEIIQSDVGINSEFLITSQAFAEETIILVNTSNPLSTEVEWILTDNVQIMEETNETITLRFNESGAYEVTLRSFQGDCFQDYTKPVVVEEARDLPDIGDADTPFIIDFITYPNPTTGEFIVAVTLKEKATISLRLFNLTSSIALDDRQEHNASEYKVNYNISLPSGIYFLLLETNKGSEIRKIVIQ